MEHILEKLDIDWIEIEFQYRIDEDIKVSYLVKNIKDRIIFIVEINEEEELLTFTKKLPQNGDSIRAFIKEITDDNVLSEQKISLGQYLWDLYVVGVYSNKEKKLNPMKIAQIERDRFIARKIFVEYSDEQDLLDKLHETIYPHKALDLKINKLKGSTKLNPENLLNKLHHIDTNNVNVEQVHTLITLYENAIGAAEDEITD